LPEPKREGFVLTLIAAGLIESDHEREPCGRENGQDAIWEYLQTKSIWISTADEVPNPFVMR